jgi:methylmalonyl-CoA mutase
MKGKPLFEDFPEVSAKAWKQKIQYELKGKDYNQEMVWDSPEGIKVKPFYHADDLSGVKTTNLRIDSWKIGQTIYAGNAIMANEKALKFLAKGAEAIQFIIPNEEVDVILLLKNINILSYNVYLEMQFLSKKYISNLFTKVADAEKIHFQIDLINHLSRSGNWYQSLEKDHELFDELLEMDIDNLISIDTSLYENAGAHKVQQLAFGLAHANEYLNHLEVAGKLKTLKQIQFKVSVEGNYFFEIAKLKALRLLWDSLCDMYEISCECHITTSPSKRNKTIYDYNVNLLRTTTECMSAILGGSNTVFNLPYDSIYHKDNDFAERIALNQLVVLKEESYFDQVANPAEGSYYIESITEQLAEKALELFKSIEKNGGFLSQLKNHSIQNKIMESAKKQQDLFDSGEEVLVGTNKFQSEEDVMKGNLELYPFVKRNPRKTLITPIIEKRLAEELERKRLDNE